MAPLGTDWMLFWKISSRLICLGDVISSCVNDLYFQNPFNKKLFHKISQR